MAIYFQRYNGTEWVNESESSSSGTANHASLTNKELSKAGHTFTSTELSEVENLNHIAQELYTAIHTLFETPDGDLIEMEDGTSYELEGVVGQLQRDYLTALFVTMEDGASFQFEDGTNWQFEGLGVTT